MSTVTGPVRLEVEAGVARVTLVHPPLNVLTTEMLVDLAGVLSEAGADDSARVVLLTGEGRRAFCAGVDVADHTPDRVVGMMAAFASAIDALVKVDVPVVAALNGVALGGGLELALACDVILARDDVLVGQPEIRLGVFPPAASVLLPRLVGRQTALDLILTGRTMRADEARALGLITHAVAADAFDERVAEYVHGLATLSLPVLRLAKRTVLRGLERPLATALEEADRVYLDELMHLDDAREGLAAFIEKRAPAWRDR